MRPTVLTLLTSLLAVACGNDADQTAASEKMEATRAAQEPTEIQPTEQPAKPSPRVETKTYVAELVASPPAGSELSAGTKAQLLITIRPQNGWHMNHEFPTSVMMPTSEAIAPEKTTIEKKDAKRFDDDGADFVVPVELIKAGKQEAVADVSFAVCTEQTCLPEKLKLALTLDISDANNSAAGEKTP